MKTTLFAAALLTLGLLSAGCTHPGTRLKIQTPALTIEYRSTKDQYFRYNPASGEFELRSTVNGTLVEQSAAVQGQVIDAAAAILPLVTPTK